MSSPSSRTRNRQLVRVLRLLACLQRGRWALADLSRELSVSERTIRRDLAAIEEAHLVVRDMVTASTTRVWWMDRGIAYAADSLKG